MMNCRYWIFAGSIAAALLSAAEKLPVPAGKAGLPETVSSGKAEVLNPEIRGTSLVAGTKQLQLLNNFQIGISDSGIPIANSGPVCLVKELDSGKGHWLGLRAQPGMFTLKREGNRFLYIQRAKLGNDTWELARQETEFLPDGLVRVTFRWNPPDPAKYSFRSFGFFLDIPYSAGSGKKVVCDGKAYTLPGKAVNSVLHAGGSKAHRLEFFPDDPARCFTVFTKEKESNGISCYAVKNAISFRLQESGDSRELTFYLDIRRGVRASRSDSLRGGVDFRAVENLTMPDDSSRNLIVNPSFEQGMTGYHLFRHSGYNYSREKWETELYALDDRVSRFGGTSLRMTTFFAQKKGDDYRNLSTSGNLSTHHTAVAPGVYTLSFYIKGTHPGEQTFNAWVSPYNYGPYNHWLAVKGGVVSVPVTTEWTRHTATFRIDSMMPLNVRFNAVGSQRRGFVWVDGIQVEKGDRATAFDVKPVEARLVTSDPDNFLSAKARIGAKLKLTAPPDASGKGVTTIRNFYGETVFRQDFRFRADRLGRAEVALDLDRNHPGKGILMLRTDYELADGRKCYDLHRLTILDFLENKHPHRFLFSDNYGDLYENPLLYRILERWKKVGFGAKAQIFTPDPLIHDTFAKFGIPITEVILVRKLWNSPDGRAHWGVSSRFQMRDRLTPDDPSLLFRDFFLDAGGEVTPEYLAKVRNACRKIAERYPKIIRWQFSNEMGAGFPREWWSREGSAEKRAERFALIVKAFADGIRAGNPAAQVSADCPWNMNPDGGIAETEALLKAANRIGLRLDRLATHTYRATPESPDLDADTALYLKRAAEAGYTKEPLFWSEMMHWGPYTVPAWGVVSADWMGTPKTWYGGPVSYDMGWNEKVSAAWRARSWLVGLKYSDRVKTACSSSDMNNFIMDLDLTPFASQVIPNTLGNLLGDSTFRKDIRFAAYIRAYVFEDAQKRPVAAVWCHLPELDEGRQDAPVAEADFGSALESVIDLMNNERAFAPGRLRFPVTPFPLFFRGKPGTLDAVIRALENAVIVAGKGVSRLQVSANPSTPETVTLNMKNLLSSAFTGTAGEKPFTVPGSQSASVTLPLPEKLSYSRIAEEKLPLVIKGTASNERMTVDLSFRGILCRRVGDDVTPADIRWDSLPAVRLAPAANMPELTGGVYRMAWNSKGLFLRVEVRDPVFSHIEFPKPAARWANDSLQLYFDTYADARARQTRGSDDNDYEYMLFPDSAGISCSVYRARMVDWQLGLGTSQAKAGTFAADIPSTFRRSANGYVYDVFFPAKDLLPVQFRKGYVFGFGIYLNNADDPAEKSHKRRISALTNAAGGGTCYNAPHLWPAVLLWE